MWCVREKHMGPFVVCTVTLAVRLCAQWMMDFLFGTSYLRAVAWRGVPAAPRPAS